MEKYVGEFLFFLATIDPVSTLALFVGLTATVPAQDRAKIALRAVGYSAVILVGFVVLGQFALDSLGVKLASFQLAGGIIFFLFGVQMVFGSGVAAPNATAEPGHDVAIFPIAVPTIAGPGAILAAVILTDNREFSVTEQAISTCLLLLVLAITLLVLLQANRIYGLIGKAGSTLVVRILGLVLAALGVEMVLRAVTELLPGMSAA